MDWNGWTAMGFWFVFFSVVALPYVIRWEYRRIKLRRRRGYKF